MKINKLKITPRTGWVLMGVKNPETIAEHIFRMVVATWLLGQKKNLNIKRIIKVALSHDFCEVYAGDITPFFYYSQLPQNKAERKKILMRWARLSKKEKSKRGKKKFEIEKKSLLKLIKFLKPELRKEIFSSWFNFEKRITKEGNFVKQVDRIEALLQAIEYFGPKEEIGGTSWWEGTEEIVEDPLLLDFLKVIQKKLYNQVPRGYRGQKELENILNFLLEIGKLKKMPRLYWLIRGVKRPESVAGHVFTLTLMAWIFGREKKGLNMEKLLKMALCHEITAVYTRDTTPYDEILPEDKKERRKILEKVPRLLKKEKVKRFFKDYTEENKVLRKLTLKLEPSLKKEIIQLWGEYRKRNTPEGHFLAQLNVLAVLLEALQCREKKKNFSVYAIWEWVFEVCDDPLIIELIEEIKKKFYKT